MAQNEPKWVAPLTRGGIDRTEITGTKRTEMGCVPDQKWHRSNRNAWHYNTEMGGTKRTELSNFTDYSNNIKNFIDYLLKIAEREKGSENQLNYLSHPFKVSIILLAIASRAHKSGVRPYLKRLRIELEEGSNSIYVIAFSPAFKFFDVLMKSLEGHERINIEKIIETKDFAITGKKIKKEYKIAVLSKNLVFSDESFMEKIQINDIKIGDKVTGVVQLVSSDEAQISLRGMRAYIRKEDLDWFTFGNCENKLEQAKEYSFYIKEIDFNTCTIFLMLVDPETNPWENEDIPKVNDIVEIIPQTIKGNTLLCSYKGCLEVKMPFNQVFWFDKPISDYIQLIGSKTKAKIIFSDKNEKLLNASMKVLEDDPWESIHQAIPKGTELNGKVVELTDNFVRVQLKNGMVGTIPAHCLKRAGHEYSNYQQNMVLRQGIDVVVTKVFIGKKKITLDLKRNG